jgi:ATP-binding protein involved in chromosome partitioning
MDKEKQGEKRRTTPPGIMQVTHSIAVASGKGGVGKTTVAVNLALALCQQGLRVGLLDADIYGPSIPTMLGLYEQPESTEQGITPLEKFGLKVMSIGFLIDAEQPVVWRGPLASRAINDFLTQVCWGELDYLIIDLPPGTGDVSITIAKQIPDPAVVIVTTPQKVAIADVTKAISMFRRMGATILGIVENMAYFCCEHSAERIALFGAGGGRVLSEQTGLPLLASLPLDMQISQGGDAGVPLLQSHPDSESGRLFSHIARQIAATCTQLSPPSAEGQP